LSKPGLAIATSKQGSISCLAFKRHLPQPKSMTSFTVSQTSWAGWFQVPWSDEPDERRRTEALRLFRQAPAIVSLALLDNNGLERLYISRIGLNRIESRTDRSADPAVTGARSTQIWFSDVGYHRGSEPHLTVAVVGNRAAVGVVIAEVNLKLIWDVISAIKVGKTGFAFVLDRPGRLIAHPDISLVLRGAEEATSQPFRTIRDAIGPAGAGFATSRDVRGREVAAVAAPVVGPDWTVIVEQPLAEAYGPIYAALWRTAALLAAGTMFAALLAYALAHRMTEPIRVLEKAPRGSGPGLSTTAFPSRRETSFSALQAALTRWLPSWHSGSNIRNA
jgi:hypothetical protein